MATILVVDDLAANRQVLVTLLRYKGHHLLEAVNGRDALTTARDARPDLVITDVLMPVMDGYELVKQLRVDPLTRDIPVVFYTAHYGEREARDLALASGVAHVLTKPIDPEGVLEVVRRVLDGEPAADSPADPSRLAADFDHAHLRLVTDKLSATDEELRGANARLRALINIGLELASERDPGRLLQNVCTAARDLFAASYATLGILHRTERTVEQLVDSGIDAGAAFSLGSPVRGILETAVTGRRSLHGHNPGGDPAALGLPSTHPALHTYLVAPVASPTHVYGWLCLVGNEGQRFADDDEALVMALSGQVGRIYENGYYYRAARQERDRAQRYLDTAEVILLALDLDGRVTGVNRKGCDLLEWAERDLLGRDWIDTCVPLQRSSEMRAQFSALVAGNVNVVESPVLTRSGAERLIEWRNTLLRDEAGKVIGTLSSGTDITEQHRAVEALRTAEERMRFALQSADVGIWDMNYVTGTLRWSHTLEAHYGLAPGTFGGTMEDFLARVHPDDRALVEETLGAAVVSGADFSLQNRSVWPDGTVRWLTGAGRVVLDATGAPVRGVGVSLDVTQRHELEARYHQAQKMEAVGRLAGGVAHDFNNLLTAILGYNELMLEGRAKEDSDYGSLLEVKDAGERAAALTRQLLAFSRKQIIEPVVLDLNDVIGRMRALLERLIGEDIHVTLRLGEGVGRIKADRGQIEQIVMNLAVNARDAMPLGGTLTIETANADPSAGANATPSASAPGSYVQLTVSDTGTGMSQDTMTRLFEPFFTTKEPGKGTGLGLATVHGVVSANGGTVAVSSELGHGSSFVVSLPRVEQTLQADAAASAPAASPRGSETVLVVEDADAVRELARRLLERLGYSVLLAANTQEALRLLDSHPAVDVLLTDVILPGLSGPELARRMRERLPALKVVYMSGYTEDAITQHGVVKPGITLLHKPFTSATLGRKLREALNGAARESSD